MESFRLIHILTFCAFDSIEPVPTNIPNSSLSTQLDGSDPNDSKDEAQT